VTSTVVMVRPTGFQFNEETAVSNAFMHRPTLDAQHVRNAVDREFAQTVEALTTAGVRVIVFDDADPPNADAVFPNNWFTTYDDGTVVLHPMATPSRRRERRPAILESLRAEHAFDVRRIVDLTAIEREGESLEGTGSLVLDRAARVAYIARSERSTFGAMSAFAREMDYDIVAFNSTDSDGQAVYHTNVMMGIGETFAIVALASIDDDRERAAVDRRLRASGLDIIDIDRAQTADFLGNTLALRAVDGAPILVLSTRARTALRPEQVDRLEPHVRLVTTDVSTIEHISGGGVRCMLAEVFLPRTDAITM
jgi:hypothetical protein